VVLDYPGKRITIARGALGSADNRRIFEYGADEELPVVPVRVGGREYHIHLDSVDDYFHAPSNRRSTTSSPT